MKPDIVYEGLTADDLRPEAREDFHTNERVKGLMVGAPRLISLEEEHLEDVLVDYGSYRTPEDFDLDPETGLTGHIRSLFSDLTDREMEVMSLRVMGSKTLKEVGEIIGMRERSKPLSPSRIWHIEHDATLKLLTPETSAK